ncbi:phosphotransferase [bacterium]|jgi:hypothetical protein|nr:phosphotransferase [bacterium]
MIKLLRNATHQNSICLYSFNLINSSFYRKTTYDKSSLCYIENEIKGWQWYEKTNKSISNSILNHKLFSNFGLVDIKKINGQIHPTWKGYTPQSKKTIVLAVEHYFRIWKKEHTHLYPIHGDLSLDNIIVNNNEITFIDWEHFQTKATPFWHDIFYLLFETFWCTFRKNNKICVDSLMFIKKTVQSMHNKKQLDSTYLKAPLKTTINIVKQLWDESDTSIRINNKFPILNFSNSEILEIDTFIKK